MISNNFEKTIHIVGAGITGIATALFCRDHALSYQVDESRSCSGGILRDWYAQEDWFFRNCQYLSPESSWVKLLPQESLHVFPHCYGSYTDIWGPSTSFSGYAGPVYASEAEPSPLRSCEGPSLRDRINIYPTEISVGLTQWVNKLQLNSDTLHNSAAIGLQFSRIFPLHHSLSIGQLKKTDPIADDVYGLPRKIFGLAPALAAVPKDGYTRFFEDIVRSLNISYHQFVNPSILEKLNTKNYMSANSNYAIWTGNPTPLLKHFSGYTLDSPTISARNLVLKHTCYNFPNPFYVQVFSLHHSVTRIFFYFDKITVECLDDSTTVDDILASCEKIMSNFIVGQILKPEQIHVFKERRFFLTSLCDYQAIKQYIDSTTPSSGLIASPWHQYGRDQKINYVLSSLKDTLYNGR